LDLQDSASHPLSTTSPVTALAAGLPAQRAIAQRFCALCRFSAAGMKVYPRAVAAGGRKAPRHEIAVGCGQRLSRVLWGFRGEFGLAEAGALRSMRSRYLDGRWYASVRPCGPQVGRPD